MLSKPKFRDYFRVENVGSEGIFLLSERNFHFLKDPLYQLLATSIDGQNSIDEIVDIALPYLVSEGASQPQIIEAEAKIYHALMLMEEEGYIVENEKELPPHLTVFCDNLGLKPAAANCRLQTTKVAVKSLGNVEPYSLISLLESLHIQVSDQGKIAVILTDDYLQEGLETFNQTALQLKRPWLLVRPLGTVIWIGPLFIPGKTGCWECLSQRLQSNRPVEGFIQRRRQESSPLTPPLANLPSIQQTALNMAATEILKWILQGENKRLERGIITHDTLTLETQNHVLIKRPQCPSCGILKPQLGPLPAIVGSRKKTFTADGGHRCLTPEETFEKYCHHISPITGIVRELGKLSPDLKGLTPTYFARHHFASMFDDFGVLRQNIGGRSAGKGRTDAQAKASGFCEAIERYSGVFQGDEIRVKGSYQTMGKKAIHPNACLNFSQAQYEDRQQWNDRCGSFFQRVPEPFDEAREIEWTPIWSLTYQDFKYLPTAYCYFGYPMPSQPDCWADTNGCAAGNTLEEAILQGFLELVERDSVALWWYNRLPRPGVDLESFDEPYFQALVRYYHSLQRELWVLDLTGDLQIPAFAAISRRCDRPVEDIILGFGAHFEAKLALQRALTEVNQILPAVLTAKADGTTQYAASADASVLDWWQGATRSNQPYLAPLPGLTPKKSADYPQVSSDDLLDDLKLCQQIVEQRGLEMLVLDQTRPDIGLKVVKVVVPGLRHFWKRLGPGRLYEVPVQLGWLPESIPEDQLNPYPMWM